MNFKSIVGASLALGFAAVATLYQLNQSPAGERAGSPLVVYVAAGLLEPTEAAARAFTRETQVPVQLEPGPSGKLLAQLSLHPRHADVFIAADEYYVVRGQQKRLIGDIVRIAAQHPILVVPAGNPAEVTSLDDLLQARVRVMLANPELASIGRSTKRVLGETGHWEPLVARSRDGSAQVSFSATVNEVAQAVRLKAADAGIIWDSLQRQYKLQRVSSPRLEAASHRLAAGVARTSQRQVEARAFAAFLAAPGPGLAAFRSHGFGPLEKRSVEDVDPVPNP